MLVPGSSPVCVLSESGLPSESSRGPRRGVFGGGMTPRAARAGAAAAVRLAVLALRRSCSTAGTSPFSERLSKNPEYLQEVQNTKASLAIVKAYH